MKKVIVNLLLILVLLVTNINVFAEGGKQDNYQQLSKKQELKLFYNCDINDWLEMDENYIYKLIDNYNFFYETQEKLNIKDLNITQFYVEFAVETLVKENNDILKELNNISNDYVLIRGAKVFSPYLSLKIHLLNNAYENRIRLIEDLVKNENSEMYFEYDNSYFYDNQRHGQALNINERLNDKEIGFLINAILETLNNPDMPQNLFENLNIILSPYSFKYNVGGYALTLILDGREESVIISARNGKPYEEVKETILHELGHIFMTDLAGKELFKDTYNLFYRNINVWNDFKNIYPELIYDEFVYFEKPVEYMAEDFKQYFLNKENYETNIIKSLLSRKVFMEYNENFTKFMDKYLPIYKPNVEKTTIDFKVFTSESESNYNLLNVGNYRNVVTFKPNIKLIHDKQNKQFSNVSYILYDENENIILDGTFYGYETSLSIPKYGTYNLRIYIESPGWRVWSGEVCIKYLEKNY